MAAFTWLMTNWKAVMFAAVLALGVWHYVGLRDTIADQRVAVAELQRENDVLLHNNTILEESIKANNEAIALMTKGADQTKKDFASLDANVRNQTTRLEKRLADILEGAKPETCNDTIKYLIDAVGEYGK